MNIANRDRNIYTLCTIYKEKLIQVYGLKFAAESDLLFPKPGMG